jgi:hypothetical protein
MTHNLHPVDHVQLNGGFDPETNYRNGNILSPLERIRRRREEWDLALSEFRDLLPFTFNRLRWLCEEALKRIEVETAEDFLAGVVPMNREIVATGEALRSMGLTRTVPLEIREHEYWPPQKFEDHGLYVLCRRHHHVWDPLEPYGLSRDRVLYGFAIESDGDPREQSETLGQTEFKEFPYPNKLDGTRETQKQEVLQYLSRWVRFLNEELEKLGTASPTPEVPQEAEHLSETDLLKQHFPTSKGQQKAIKILELMRQGLPQKDIAARVGLTKGRVSEYMAKLRELFPDLSPSLQSSETVRKTSRR